MKAPLRLDADQLALVAASEEDLVLLTGGPGSGKTTALMRRVAARIAAEPAASLDRFIVTSPVPRAGSLRHLVREAIDPARHGELDAVPWMGGELATLAYAILAENAFAARLALDLTLIADEEAEVAFERAGASLFAMEWTEFVTAQIDPELAGMRAPERFAAAALRLFRKLRAALIGPEEFLERALRGAVSFYAAPPNFADPSLLGATREEYRDSLGVGRAELERQRLREIDLAKVLGRLYQSYLDELVKTGCLTATDALAEATRLLAERPEIAERTRARFVAAFVDDAQDLTLGAVRFLQELFGAKLQGVTLAGDREQATQTFAGARPERVFGLEGTIIELRGSYRATPALGAIARASLGKIAPGPPSDEVRLFRGRTQDEEAAFIADEIAGLLAGGTPPGDVALAVRSFVWMRRYRDRLIDAGVPVMLSGSIDLYDEPDVEDALALLWSACDPFRHDWLLRALTTPTVRLNDLGLYLLCGEPSNPQTALFELPDDSDSVRSRWDRRRNLRLALNVARGDRDADLDPPTREAVAGFRERRLRWERLLLELAVEDAAERIIVEGGLRAPVRGETPARARLRDDLLDALVGRIEAFAARDRRRTLSDFLVYAERATLADRPAFETIGNAGVTIGSIEALKGREFAHVFVCNLKAGAFPAYYAPDAFLFSPTFGIVPKDNVGDAETTRTAKFTWYSHRAKLKELYTGEDRRALYCAISRASRTATLTASGRPTRGIGAPELLAELQNAHLPYAVDLSGSWKASHGRVDPALPDRLPPAAVPPGASFVVTVDIADLAEARRCHACARRGYLARIALGGAAPAGAVRFRAGIVTGVCDAGAVLATLDLSSSDEVEALLADFATGRAALRCAGCADFSA